MVKVREHHPMHQLGAIDLDQWIDRISSQVELPHPEELKKACQVCEKIDADAIANNTVWYAETSPYRTGLEMAEILAELNMDQESIIAAVLYRVVREDRISLAQISKQFDENIAKLIEGVLQMAAISGAQTRGTVLGQNQSQVDNVRKMLVAMVDDVRVALIKLAERTTMIRSVKNADADRKRKVAREVFDIYAPLAHRLGIGHIKWELEDVAFRYLEAEAYKRIAKLLDEKRLDRQYYIENVVDTLKQAMESAGIECEVAGRAKHIYSIWRKMKRKNIDFNQVYDIRAVRILVPEIKDCYAALGIVHTFWRHIPHEFDDYVANPKENGYQSLHTAVIGPENKILEVQIRTHQMHEESELGVCAHHRYKGHDTKSSDDGYEGKINWLRQVLEWHDEMGDATELLGDMRNQASADRIYVFTPEGHVVDLMPEASPIDFAYRVHTEVGHRCRGAKVNGRIVPLTYKLQTGESVEILTGNESQPRRDWLNPEYGYIRSPRARAKVSHWFKQQDKDHNEDIGRNMVIPELERLSLLDADLKVVAKQVNYKDESDMFAAVGAGDLRVGHILSAAQKLVEPVIEDEPEQLTYESKKFKKPKKGSKDEIHIRGVGNLLTTMANCCQPVPGEPIAGYITQGRGVSIHRQDCVNLLGLKQEQPNRVIEVSWGGEQASFYPVDIDITAYDRYGLLSDITGIFANDRVNVLKLNTVSNPDSTADMQLTIEVESMETLGRILNKINQLPNVMHVRRNRGTSH